MPNIRYTKQFMSYTIGSIHQVNQHEADLRVSQGMAEYVEPKAAATTTMPITPLNKAMDVEMVKRKAGRPRKEVEVVGGAE